VSRRSEGLGRSLVIGPLVILWSLVLGIWSFSQPSEAVRGLVVAENAPVAQARVRLKGTPVCKLSDDEGRFHLPGRAKRVTAWKKGYFIAGADAGEGPIRLALRPLPREDNPDYEWVDPRPSQGEAHNCGNCHRQIYDEWAGSAHARAGRNKHVLNLYDGSDWHGNSDRGWNLLKDHPNGAAVCVACHAPSVPFNDPGFDDLRKLSGIHAQGVHCDYCHKIGDTNTERLGLEHGRYAYELLRPSKGQLFFGPLDDVDRDEDAFSPLYQESRYCAVCHEGTLFGTRVYTTYSEWLESPARKQGKQCQTCHMAATGKMTNIAPGRGGIERDPAMLASHHTPGPTKQMLRDCLRLAAWVRTEKEALEVTVELTASNVGHRVPTGFIDRHLILLVEALSDKEERSESLAGPKLPDSAGLGDPAQGNYARLPGHLFARQIADADGRLTPFWKPNQEIADTRLKPDTPERFRWKFDRRNVAEVRVRLLYRRFYKAVADEKGWMGNEVGVFEERVGGLTIR
jgi:hypothetical protein